MAKLGIFASIVTIVGALAFASGSSAETPTPCHQMEFKTELVKNACATGGQAEAKAVMKKFSKAHKVKSCKQCHSKLSPTYALKPDALKRFKELGGK
jgi:hypothetical protein